MKLFTRIGDSFRETHAKAQWREQIIAEIKEMVIADTKYVLEAGYSELESYYAANAGAQETESHYADIRNRTNIGDGGKRYTRYSDDTLIMIRDAFKKSPDGMIHRLIKEAPAMSYSNDEAFVRERITIPEEMEVSRIGVSGAYRAVRSGLRVDDMSKLPIEKHAGIRAGLNIANYASEAYINIWRGDPKLHQMAPELMDVIMDYPERCQDIKDFMVRGIRTVMDSDKPIDSDHLRSCLESPSRVLMEGVL